MKKSPCVDVFALKKAFYEMCGCATAFEEKWTPFLQTYGKNDTATRYLRTQLYDQRHGAVLSFRHFSTHWFGGKMIEFDAPAAVFDKNKKMQLDVDEVIGHQGREEAPSRVPENVRPKRAKVARTSRSGPPTTLSRRWW